MCLTSLLFPAGTHDAPAAHAIPYANARRPRRSSGGRWGAHPVVLEEVLATGRHELVLARMVHHFVANNAGRGMRPVLVGVVTKVGDRSVRAGYQHFGNGV